MPAIRLIGFRGEQPRLKPRVLPESGAQSAVDCRLDDGGLTPIRRPIGFAEATAGHQTIFRFGDEWLSWPGVVHATPGPVDTSRLYYTGDGAPKMLHAGTVYPLALPAPATALTATVGGSGAGDLQTRIYVYTWVTSFGEESEPCAASNEVDWQPGQTVTLSGFTAAPAGRAITQQRIYRSQTGNTGTYLYLIAERTAGATDFVDDVAQNQFQEVLPSLDWTPPPDGLEGLVALTNGMMAGFVGKAVYFCEPYRPHAWPAKFMQLVDHDIVALAAIGTTLMILTKGTPAFASGATPETMRIEASPANIACIGARGVTNLGFGVCYPGPDGLAMISVDGAVRYVSTGLFDRDRWLSFDPANMIGAQHQGQYVGFYDVAKPDGTVSAGTLLITIGDAPFLVRSALRASAAFFDKANGALCVLEAGSGDIVRFDDPTAARAALYWKSKAFQLPYGESFGVIKVDADLSYSAQELAAAADKAAAVVAANEALLAAGDVGGGINGSCIGGVDINGDHLLPPPPSPRSIAVGIYADGRRVATVERTNTAVRLPGGFRGEIWEIDVAGVIPVTQIVMARTVNELKAVV